MGRSTKTTGGAGLTLGMIRAVSEAVRTRSMTEAALVLGVSQSAVTQQVNKFEVLTGLKVLSRVGNTLFVEREDVANLMERISVLSAHMDRILQDGSRKQTLALPYSISALITVDPALAQGAKGDREAAIDQLIAIVQRDRLVAHDLMGLVPAAGNQHHVGRCSLCQHLRNGGRTVGLGAYRGTGDGAQELSLLHL